MANYSEIFTFKLNCNCERWTPYRFSWLNRLGGLDSYTFRLNSTESISVERQEFEKYLSYLKSDNSFGYSIGDRGKQNYDIKVITKYSVVSEWQNEETHKWLEELFTSPQVYLISTSLDGDITWDPIIITSNSVEIRDKKGYGNRLLSHNIEFIKSYKKVIQRG